MSGPIVKVLGLTDLSLLLDRARFCIAIMTRRPVEDVEPCGDAGCQDRGHRARPFEPQGQR